jgi:hypothetical protein
VSSEQRVPDDRPEPTDPNKEHDMKNTTWLVTEKHTTTKKATLTVERTDWTEYTLRPGEDEDDLNAQYDAEEVAPETPGAAFDLLSDGTLTIDLTVEEAIGIEPGDHFRMGMERVYPVPFVPSDA